MEDMQAKRVVELSFVVKRIASKIDEKQVRTQFITAWTLVVA